MPLHNRWYTNTRLILERGIVRKAEPMNNVDFA